MWTKTPAGGPPALDKDTVSKLFGNISNIVTISTRLLEDLDTAFTGFTAIGAKKEDVDALSSRVASVFHAFAPYFSLYSIYISNYDTMIATLQGLTGSLTAKDRARLNRSAGSHGV